MLNVKTILHPTDFSEAADQALHVAHSLARDHQAKLVLVTAPPPPTLASQAFLLDFPYDPAMDAVGHMEYARRLLSQLAGSITDLPVEIQVVTGVPGAAIVTAAKNWSADLIVMGTQGRKGVTRLLMGSVAEYVLRHASCPVLTIKLGTSQHLNRKEETAPVVTDSATLASA